MFSSLYFWVGVILGWVSLGLFTLVIVLIGILVAFRKRKQFTQTQQMQDMFQKLSQKGGPGPGIP